MKIFDPQADSMVTQQDAGADENSIIDAATPDELQLGQYIPLHYHYVMLQDKLRVDGFQAAIESIVQPSMHVVELGGGTGILSSFAARAGAEVTCVERNPALAKRAAELLQRNGLSELVEVVNADAMRFVPNRPVDVVICEMLHVGMLREKQLSVIEAFKRNYRATFGEHAQLPVFIPEASVLMIQPVQQDFVFNDYEAPLPIFQSLESIQDRTIELGVLEPYAVLSYDEPLPMHFDVQQQVEVNHAGACNALRFAMQNVLAVDMDKQSATSWPNHALVLPLQHDISVTAGDRLDVQFCYPAGGSIEELLASLDVAAASGHQAQRRAA